MSKLTFARSNNGRFDFSEERLEKFNAALRERAGQQGPMLPATLMGAASIELIRSIHNTADARNVPFAVAAARVVRQRPELFWLTRGLACGDNDSVADVELG